MKEQMLKITKDLEQDTITETDSFKWDRLSQKERLVLIERWEKEDAYQYGRSNSKRLFRKLSHYLKKRAIEL